jgi:hypothetical protein
MSGEAGGELRCRDRVTPAPLANAVATCQKSSPSKVSVTRPPRSGDYLSAGHDIDVNGVGDSKSVNQASHAAAGTKQHDATVGA